MRERGREGGRRGVPLDQEINKCMCVLLAGEWPKLQSAHIKPHWIKLDFDHYHMSEDEEEEDDEETRKRKELERVRVILDVTYGLYHVI